MVKCVCMFKCMCIGGVCMCEVCVYVSVYMYRWSVYV